MIRHIKNFFKPRQWWRITTYINLCMWWRLVLYILLGWHEYFDIFITPNYVKNIDALRAYNFDLREIFVKNSIKDINEEWNNMFIYKKEDNANDKTI